MLIVIGLGNPGEKFNHTRHNVGFMAVDFFAKHNDFPVFNFSKKYESLTSEKIPQKSHANILKNVSMEEDMGEKIIMAKPQTFMNESGRAVQSVLKNKNEVTLVVVRDDIDLPLGKIKFTKDSGAGGHKGVDSIIQHIGNNNFIQLKIGIGAEGEKVKALEVVLEKFSKEEQEVLRGVIQKSSEALKKLIDEGLERAMNEYNK